MRLARTACRGLDQRGQLVGFEFDQPRPEPDEGCPRRLRLEADQMLEGVGGAAISPFEQQLAGECRSIECALTQEVAGPVALYSALLPAAGGGSSARAHHARSLVFVGDMTCVLTPLRSVRGVAHPSDDLGSPGA
jgi:hypothetical protein